MKQKRGRLQLGIIWGLVAGLAVLQVALWSLAGTGPDTAAVLYLVAGWVVVLSLAMLASRGIGTLTERLAARETAHRATLDEVQQLQTQNAMLQIVARSVDVALDVSGAGGAHRQARPAAIGSGWRCSTRPARSSRPSPPGSRKTNAGTARGPMSCSRIDSTAIGQVVRTLDPMLINDASDADADLLDVNVLHDRRVQVGADPAARLQRPRRGHAEPGVTPGAIVSGGRHRDLRPIAEILAVAHVAQQLHMLLGKHRTTEAMADVMLSIAAEINSALQIIVGHCDLLERGYPDPQLQRDLATVVRQAQRIAELLEKMRTTANDRLKEVAHSIEGAGIPTSPDAYAHDEV